MSMVGKAMNKEKLEQYLSEKYSEEEGQKCTVILENLKYLGETKDGDEKIYFAGIIRRSG